MKNTKLLILMGIFLGSFCFNKTAAAQVTETKSATTYQLEESGGNAYHFKSQAWFAVRDLLLNYKEKFSDSSMRKKWGGPAIKLDIGVNAYRDVDENNLIGIKLQGGYLRSGKKRETIDSSDISTDNDKLQIKGIDLFLGISWVRLYNNKLSLEHTLGLGDRQYNFTREGLTLDSESLGKVTWETHNQYISYSPALTYQTTPNLSVSLKPSVAYIFFAQSNNDMTGTIWADDGYILGAALRADYQIGESTSVFLEGNWEHQKINEKASSESDEEFPLTFSEWPSNELSTLGLAAGLTINF